MTDDQTPEHDIAAALKHVPEDKRAIVRATIKHIAANRYWLGRTSRIENMKPSPNAPDKDAKTEEMIMGIVERAIKDNVLVSYRLAFVLEQQLLAANAREPIAWGHLRFAHIDEFWRDIDAIMAEPQRLPMHTVSYHNLNHVPRAERKDLPPPAPVAKEQHNPFANLQPVAPAQHNPFANFVPPAQNIVI